MLKKWKAILALVVIYFAAFMDWRWIWGILFLSWTIPLLYTGKTYLIDEVLRKENPLVFWLICGTWIWLSVYLILIDLLKWYEVYYG